MPIKHQMNMNMNIKFGYLTCIMYISKTRADLYKVYRALANATDYSIINPLITISTPHNVEWMQSRKKEKKTPVKVSQVVPCDRRRCRAH